MSQELLQPSEPYIPESLVASQPFVCLSQRLWIDPTKVRAAAHGSLDEAGSLERLDVLRRRRKRHVVRFGELANRVLAQGKPLEHAPAGRVAEGAEDKIELRWMFNHTVEHYRAVGNSQPFI
jgi:hypothetical protein